MKPWLASIRRSMTDYAIDGSAEFLLMKKAVTRTARSLTWTITVGRNAAVVYIISRLRLEY